MDKEDVYIYTIHIIIYNIIIYNYLLYIYIYIYIYIYTHTHTHTQSNTDETGAFYAYWSKSKKDKNSIISLICGILKKNTSEYNRTEKTHRYKLVFQGGAEIGRLAK